jgi:peroxiredoxin
LLVAGLVAGCLPVTVRSTARVPAVGKPAPATIGRDADDVTFSLEDYRGKVVLLDFTAEWCRYCQELLPEQREIHQRYQGRPFAIVAVSADNTREELRDAQRRKALPWRSWWDGPSGPIARLWGVDAFPTLVLIDSHGVVRYRTEGKPPAGELESHIQTLLNETQAGK